LVLVHFLKVARRNAPTEGGENRRLRLRVAAGSQELQTAAHASLGPEACRVFGTEESCNPNSATAETGWPYSEGRVLRGRSDSVSSRRAWKDASGFVFWNGPVVRIVPSLENSLNEAHR